MKSSCDGGFTKDELVRYNGEGTKVSCMYVATGRRMEVEVARDWSVARAKKEADRTRWVESVQDAPSIIRVCKF